MHTKNIHIIHPNYRPDIDGLRAVAIISVVLFHAFRDNFKGGFIGVDVFFVISGFLISTIIFSSLEQDRFSILEFYKKRIRRIFPALILVLLTSILFGWLVLLPDEFEHIGNHLAAGVGFVSNFIIWREAGYFDKISETKPLLHLWSLAIEEQFYLFWPVLLALVWKKGLNFLFITSVIAIISFVANIYLIDDHPVAAFFLPISRFWELMAGGVLSYITLHLPALLRKNKNAQSIIGFSLILTGLLLLNKGSEFPGWWALLPTFGSFFIISGGPDAWLNERILSNNVMVLVGKISYPMYLWHWPLLSFAYILNNGNISYSFTFIALLATLILSLVTYYFVEKPVRFGKHKVAAVPIMLALMVGLLATGFLVKHGIISPKNNNDSVRRIVDARNDTWQFQNGFSQFNFGKEHFHSIGSNSEITVLFGDSHINQYGSRINYLFLKHPNDLNTMYFATHEGCLPIPRVFENTTENRVCNNYRSSMTDILNNKNIKTVVLGACWSCYFISDPTSNETKIVGLEKGKTLDSLKEFLVNTGRSRTVYLLLDNPIGAEFNPSHYLNGNRIMGFTADPIPLRVQISTEQMELRNQLKDIAKQANAIVVDPIDSLCKGDICISSNENGEPIYRDGDHLRSSYTRDNASYIDNALLGHR